MDGADARRLSKTNLLETITMKKFLLGTVALVALGATVPALAADLGARPYNKAPVYAAPIYNWTGFYIGGHVGAVFPGGFAYNNNQRGLGSVTGRFGYTWGPGLLYVKGGYAFSDNNESVTFGGVPVAFAMTGNHRDGYTVGAGLEYMFAPSWSAKIEYQYYNFGSASFTAPAGLVPVGSFTTDDHTVKAGLNYRFNWGGPVVAK